MAIYDSLTILTEEEIGKLYEIPKIDHDDRERFFEITPEDEVYLDELTDSHSKIDYLLQLGYFRAVRQFYKFNFEDVKDDVWFIINNHYPTYEFPEKKVSRNKYYAAQKTILGAYDYKRYDSISAVEFDQQAKRLSKRDLCPKFIFDELLGFCEQQKTVRPKYSTLQTLVSSAISREENRLGERLGRLLSKESKEDLAELLNNDDTVSNLTLLKQDPKTFATNHMRKELDKHQKIYTLFQDSKHVISALGISRQNIQYYAETCDFYEPHQLRRFSQKKSRLCMLCFVWQKFIKINDHLATYMAHKTHAYEELGSGHAMTSVLEAKLDIGKDRKLASKMLKVVHNKNIEPEDIRPQCYGVVEKDNFAEFTDRLANPEIDQKEYEWKYYSKEHGSIKLNLRPIFMAIDFNCDTNVKLESAIKYAKYRFLSKDTTTNPHESDTPMGFMPAIQLKYLTYKKMVKKTPDSKRKTSVKFVDIKRYEVMLYRAIASAINSGSVFISDSVNYRHLEDELIPIKRWQKDKDEILKELSDCLLLTPIVQLLKEKEEILEELYKTVNKRIKSGENKEIKLDDKSKLQWTLPYKRAEDKANNPFYDKIQTTSITNVIDYAAKHTNLFGSFIHILHKGSRSQALPEHLKAYFVSQGTSIGNKRMAESSDVSLDNLNNIGSRFVRFNTLVDASNEIINKTAQLPIFKHYNLSDYGIHASLDGQKIETKYQTILSRYSTKYFGYGKGVVSYSLIANHLPVNTKIIGSNEHESHHVLDIVYYNSSDLNITSVSGDMHSVNRVNFALMNLFRYDFMPRFTHINSKADKNLVSFKNIRQHETFLIKPSNQVKKELIIDEWDNILRILASLALKETTQSVIIKKLSSYSKTNPALKALIEYDKIIMSTYMLNYINDISLRRRVYRALNRGESFHQLRSSILQISGKKLLGKTDIAFEVSNQCNKLLACCMIYYNTSILSELLVRAQADGNKDLCEQIKRLSPIAWQHINLLGNFTFRSGENIIDIQQVVDYMLDEDNREYMP